MAVDGSRAGGGRKARMSVSPAVRGYEDASSKRHNARCTSYESRSPSVGVGILPPMTTIAWVLIIVLVLVVLGVGIAVSHWALLLLLLLLILLFRPV